MNQHQVDLTAPIAMLHMTGGLGVLVGENRQAALLAPGSGDMVFFSILKRTPAFSILREHTGIRVLGRNRFHDAAEMQDPVTPNFSLAILSHGRTCLAHAQEHHWSGVGNTLHKAGRGPEALLASRTRAQIRLCTARLERLSMAYRIALTVASAKDWKAGTTSVTSDKYAYYIASEYRSLLNELYALRDALLAVAFRLRFSSRDSFSMKSLKRLVLAEPTGSAQLIAESMFLPTGDLLIDRMSLYRSLALHCLGATNPIFGDIYKLEAAPGPYGELRYLVFPLYDDVEKMRAIEQGSSKGTHEHPPREEAERFLSLPSHLDAMEFCYDCFERLLRIAESLAVELAIAPTLTTITDRDILEATITDESGQTRHLRRDPETGELVELSRADAAGSVSDVRAP